ncbi:MAG: hypothetical protein LBH32_08475 [Dysgonamonadaceae bacterium]|jgi:hypothetical protein|nr:hypothetical protein [Dysgonamonadaceae bacterium]
MDTKNKQFKNDKSPEYYRHYPRLFHKYFEDIDKRIIDELSEAAYVYYKSVLLIDNIIDNKKIENIFQISTLQEKTIKILTSIFGINADFWKYWDCRKQEFAEAVDIERKLIIQKEVAWEDYTSLADKKSAMGKMAIDSLYQLSKDKNNDIYQSLLESHYYFSAGFQLYDDVKDFEDDFKIGQFNWAIYELSKQIDFNQYQNEIHVLHKYLFIKGIAENVLSKSIETFQKAIDIILPLGINSEWLNVIKEMKNTIANYLNITSGYLNNVKKERNT